MKWPVRSGAAYFTNYLRGFESIVSCRSRRPSREKRILFELAMEWNVLYSCLLWGSTYSLRRQVGARHTTYICFWTQQLPLFSVTPTTTTTTYSTLHSLYRLYILHKNSSPSSKIPTFVVLPSYYLLSRHLLLAIPTYCYPFHILR